MASYDATELDFGNMFMPFDIIQDIILANNQQAEMAQYPLVFEELPIFYRMLLAMTLAPPSGDQCDLWNVDNEGIIPAINYVTKRVDPSLGFPFVEDSFNKN